MPTRQLFGRSPERVDGKLTDWGKFAQHRRDARQRGIAFKLTFEQWWTIWQRSGKYQLRGRHKGQYVMARLGDDGPYSVNNVEIIRCEKNHIDGTRGRPQPWNIETARRMGLANRGKKLTKEHRQAISNGLNRFHRGDHART